MASHTAAVLDERGQLLDQQRFPAARTGYQALREWVQCWPQRCWAVEGAHGVGRALTWQLVTDGRRVVDVPAKLAARVRVLSTGRGRKTDVADAVSVAVAALGAPSLRTGRRRGHAVVLDLLTNRREDLVRMRTQTINRLQLSAGRATDAKATDDPGLRGPGHRSCLSGSANALST